MKRLLCVLLTAILIVFSTSSCQITNGGGTETTASTSETEEGTSTGEISLEGYIIVYDGMDDMQKRMAVKLQNALKNKGVLLDMQESFAVNEGDHNPYLRFANDSSLTKGDFSIEVKERAVYLSAGDYNGFSGAVNTVVSLGKKGMYPFADGYEKTGNFVDVLGSLELSSKYAYDRGGDHRVMFYNVLWNNPSPDERNALKAEMVAEYLPDVLGLQEFDWSVRGGAGVDGDFCEMLADLGYAESMDYRVENVTREICDYWGKDYDNTGTFVTVDGKSFRTFYNNTPLFYNTATTEWVDGGYHMYQNQYDEVNGKDSANPMGGPSSCASKSLTWGVFRSLETRETYAVISTHMCTKSDGVRGLQAAEAISIVNMIVAEYDCPVFFGGDMNGNLGDANYDRFVEEGYVSLQDSRVASEYTSKVRTYLGSPVNSAYGLVMQGKTNLSLIEQTENKNSIDQIFAINRERVEIGVFGVIVDECTRAGSDHLPIFADFSID